MGCGGSKLEADDDTAPPGLRPFRRRIDEIRQRRSGRTITKDDALSSKQLLHEEVEDGNHDLSHPPPYDEIRMSVSSSPQTDNVVQSSPKKNATHYLMEAPDSEMRMSVSSSPLESEIVGLGKGGTSAPEKEATTTEIPPSIPESDKPDTAVVTPGEEREDEKHEEEREEDDSSSDDDDDDDEKERDHGDEIGPGSPSFSRGGSYIYDDGRYIGPGSPSFRDYFLTSASNTVDSDSADADDGEGKFLRPSISFTPALTISKVTVMHWFGCS